MYFNSTSLHVDYRIKLEVCMRDQYVAPVGGQGWIKRGFSGYTCPPTAQTINYSGVVIDTGRLPEHGKCSTVIKSNRLNNSFDQCLIIPLTSTLQKPGSIMEETTRKKHLYVIFCRNNLCYYYVDCCQFPAGAYRRGP